MLQRVDIFPDLRIIMADHGLHDHRIGGDLTRLYQCPVADFMIQNLGNPVMDINADNQQLQTNDQQQQQKQTIFKGHACGVRHQQGL